MATIQIYEFNGAGSTAAANITNSNYGSADSANIVTTTNPIFAGSNSYEKYQKLYATDFTGLSVLRNVRVYRSGAAPPASDTHVFSAGSVEDVTYSETAYATPTEAASSVATDTWVTSDPGYATIGINGSLLGSITAAGSSDYFVHQIQVDSTTTSGSVMAMVWVYETIA